MSTKTLMSVEEYLRTSFEDGDRDYVDGEVEERNVGERGHSLVQLLLTQLLLGLQPSLGIEVLPEIRIQIDESRFRVADIAVWRHKLQGLGVPNTPPAVAVEILSPEDRLLRMLPRISDYFRAGVATVWLIDPIERQAMTFTPDQPLGAVAEVLQSVDPAISIPLPAVLPPLKDYLA